MFDWSNKQDRLLAAWVHGVITTEQFSQIQNGGK